MIRARFFVAGEPATQGSKRIVQPKGHRRPMLLEVSKKLPAWRAAIGAEAFTARQRLSQALTGPLVLSALFLLRRPQRPKRPYPSLDLDKLARALLDGICTDGRLVENDAHFTRLTLAKAWAKAGEQGGVAVLIKDDEEALA